jgi:PTS system nitrogen regulatory IIA component
MNLKTILTKETINLHLRGNNKEEIINGLLDTLMAAGQIEDRTAAYEAVMERERDTSTGMKHGIAIPHGKYPMKKDLAACIGISDNPVDFDALDHLPCRIFIMTLHPAEKTEPHLHFLAEISSLFKNSEKRAAILKAESAEEVLQILTTE